MNSRFAKQAKAQSYTDIVNSAQFQELLKKKRRFIVPLTVFFFAFYFLLPVLTSYTTFLNHAAIGSISWAWVFAFAQFIMTWVLCMVYHWKAKQFDELIGSIRKNMKL